MIHHSLLFVVGVLVLSLAAACGGDEDGDAPPNVTGTVPDVTPFPGITPAPGATPQAPNPGSRQPRLQLTGVYPEPQEVALAGMASVAERPQTQFEAWDGGSVVLYDTQSGEQHDFGPGNVWTPSFGGHYFVYTSEHEVWLVDLETMRRESLGRGIVAYFLGDEHVVINPGDNAFVAVQVETRTRTPLNDLTAPLLRSMVRNRWGGEFTAEWADERHAIRNVEHEEAACEAESKDVRRCRASVGEDWLVEDLNTGEMVLSFEANKVEPAGPGEIVIATSPQCDDGGTVMSCYDLLERMDAQNPNAPPDTYVAGWSNIFTVNLETGEAQFVATASYNAGAGRWPMTWPLVADANYVVWTESFCGNPRGMTRVMDRGTGEIIELDQSHWVTLRNGKLGLGEFGAKAVVDPQTFEYLTVLPDLADVSWSADFRFAAVGQAFGHPGTCE